MNNFSHIYIEEGAESYPLTGHILDRFPAAVHIPVEHYKDVFNRSRQQFQTQKNAQKLILAVKQDPFVYPGAEVCQDFGEAHFYYTSSALNCVYNCDYCFLQGMFPSGYIVLFVNTTDYFEAVNQLLEQHPVYLCVSYETDLLAMEQLAPYSSQWIEYTRSRPDLQLEIRTKSVNYEAIQPLPPADGVILAWTLSPNEVIRRYEPKTPSLQLRLRTIRQAMEDGWRVRLCFDPILHVEGWKQHYRECVEETFAALPAEQIPDISIGTFRMGRDYMKQMRKQRPDSALVHYPFESKDGVYSYSDKVNRELIGYVLQQIGRHYSQEQVYSS